VDAFALAYHGIPRYTKDMDVFVEPSVENAQKLLNVLKEFGFSEIDLTVEELSREGMVVQLGYEPVRIDIVTSIDGCTFEEVWQNKVIGEFADVKAYFIGLGELMKNKEASGRPQDIVDLETLRRLNYGKDT
jgi:SOS-response transcriptional repressor LexA